MAWFESFDAMQTADLDSTFLGGEFSSASVVLRPMVGGVYSLTCPVVLKTGTIEPGTSHVSNKDTIQTLLPREPKVGTRYVPQRGDCLEYDGKLWDFHACKGDEAGAVTVMWQASSPSEFGKKPSQL